MSEQIRNIKSLQVFQAVALAQNITEAARVLNISQSSVSYHIKKLETELGLFLFQRTPSGLVVTEEGAVLAAHVERGFSEISLGLQTILTRADSVRIALLPMFASRWFSPRLGRLLEARPTMHVTIQNHNNHYASMLNPEGFADAGVQWGLGDWADFHVTKLWSERMVVVCGPDYLKANPISSPNDLTKCTLLHVDNRTMWEEWAERNGLVLPPTQPQMMLEDRHFQLSSTINNLGVSLFASWLVESEIQAGSLVNPFKRTFDTDFAYHLIVPRSKTPSAPLVEFCDWLKAQSVPERRLGE